MSEDNRNLEDRLRSTEIWQSAADVRIKGLESSRLGQEAWNKETSKSVASIRLTLAKILAMVAGTSASTVGIAKVLGAL